MIRDIVKINRELCTGCGDCITGCHEGALQLIDGKATLVSELMCDGLGACIGTCPVGAITIEKREAEAYDEVATIIEMIPNGKNVVSAHLQHLLDHNETGFLRQAFEYLRENEKSIPFDINEIIDSLKQKAHPTAAPAPAQHHHHAGGGCPGAAARTFAPKFVAAPAADDQPSALTHWPVQLHLINPGAAHFKGSNLLLAADCVAFSLANFHSKHLQGKTLAIACPKLDSNKEVYVQKITALIDSAQVDTITVMRMEVPCCGGLVQMAQIARDAAQRNIPIKVVEVGIQGEILDSKWI